MPDFYTFGGAVPKLETHLLPAGAAQTAENVILESGALVPLKAPLQVATATKAGTIKGLYRYGQSVTGDANYWFNTNNVSEFARGPVADDSTEATYWTEAGQPPRMTDAGLAIGSDLPSAWRLLGMPAPTTALVATVANRGITSITRSGTTATATTSQAIEFAIGQTFDAYIEGAGQAEYNGAHAGARVTGANTFTFEVTGTPATPATGTISYRYDETIETRVYAYTFVSDRSQQGPPSPLCTVNVFPGQIVTLTGFETTAAFGDRSGPVILGSKRLYRSNGGDYLQEAVMTAGATSYTSSAMTITSLLTLPNPSLLPPPASMRGMLALPNGLMAGHIEKTWMVSEKSLPHAWPTDYWLDTDYPIVGHALCSQGVVVCTTSKPYLVAVSSDPRSAAMIPIASEEGCVSGRSIAPAGDSVLYASANGLVRANGQGGTVVTDPLMTKAQWQALKPESIHGYFTNGRYYGFYDTGSVLGSFILNLASQELTFSTVYATAGFVDPRNDELYVVLTDNKICRFNAGASLTGRWRSGSTLKGGGNFSAARVEADSYPVTLRVISDGTTRTYTATNKYPFKLAGGYDARRDVIEVELTSKVSEVHVAMSMDEIK